jgi:Ca2+-binding EF-hand superfamily protein
MSFDSLDSDGNGYLSQEEFRRAHNERVEQRSEARQRSLYRNRDEAPRYADLDSDQDGRVSRGEFQAHRLQRRQQHAQEGEQRRLEHMERHREFMERQHRPGPQPAGRMAPGGGMH